MIKVALVVGGAFTIGKLAGGSLASHLNIQSDAVKLGVEVGTGILAYVILASVL